jgi:molybdopterin converting factor small subunit
MQQIKVKICHPFQDLTNGEMEIMAAGTVIAEVLEDVNKKHPRFRTKLYNDTGKLCGFVHILLNGEDMRFFQAEATPLHAGDEIAIVPAYIG